MDSILSEISDSVVAFSSDNHIIYGIKLCNILPLLKNWRKNREPDDERVINIADAIKKGEFVAKYICIAELGSDLIVYDGIHRVYAWKRCLDNNELDGNTIVVVDCIFNASNDVIVNCFKNINKSIPVPEMYIDHINDDRMDDLSIKNAINDIVKYYCVEYRMFISVSKSPQRPNFNRDMFTDNLYKLFNDMSDVNMTIDELKICLTNLNITYSKKNDSDLNQKSLLKCKKHRLFLFKDRYINKNDISVELLNIRKK